MVLYILYTIYTIYTIYIYIYVAIQVFNRKKIQKRVSGISLLFNSYFKRSSIENKRWKQKSIENKLRGWNKTAISNWSNYLLLQYFIFIYDIYIYIYIYYNNLFIIICLYLLYLSIFTSGLWSMQNKAKSATCYFAEMKRELRWT